MTDDDLPPFPSPLPMFATHALGMAVHAAGGLCLIGLVLFGPPLHPLMGEALSSTRAWLAGIAGFSTLVTLFTSSVIVLASLRLLTIFAMKRPPGLVRALMLAAVLLAHGVGCGAGIAGSGVAVFGTVFGEHGGPWSVEDR